MIKTLPHIEQSIQTLTAALPIEDAWYFESKRAPECGLTKPFQLVLFVQEGAEAHLVEAQANALLEKEFPDIAAHAFPYAALHQLPRPLVAKMALSVGHCVYQR